MECFGSNLTTAEHDSGFVKIFPFLSKRRRAALKRIRKALTEDPSIIFMDWTSGIRSPQQDKALETISSYSSVTLEAIHDHYAERDHRGIVRFFIWNELALPTNEMLLRAVFSYYDVLDTVLHEDELRMTSGNKSRFENIFTAAKAAHSSFMMEDVSTLEGPARASFEALIILYAANVGDVFIAKHSMSHDVTALVMEHPDRVEDILDYQEARNLYLSDLHADAVAEYLDTPAVSLSQGLL